MLERQHWADNSPRETYHPSRGTFDMSPDIEVNIFYLTPKVSTVEDLALYILVL